MKQCHKCGTEWKGYNQPAVKAQCEKCASDLHVCMNCEFYDILRSNSCRSDSDYVRDKERFNYCEEFQFSQKQSNSVSPKSTAKESFNKLFKTHFKKDT